MPNRGRPAEERVRDILLRATPKAAQLLVRMMNDEAVSNTARMDCAKEVLSRIFGRAGTPIQNTEKNQVEVVFREGETEEER